MSTLFASIDDNVTLLWLETTMLFVAIGLVLAMSLQIF